MTNCRSRKVSLNLSYYIFIFFTICFTLTEGQLPNYKMQMLFVRIMASYIVKITENKLMQVRYCFLIVIQQKHEKRQTNETGLD